MPILILWEYVSFVEIFIIFVASNDNVSSENIFIHCKSFIIRSPKTLKLFTIVVGFVSVKKTFLYKANLFNESTYPINPLLVTTFWTYEKIIPLSCSIFEFSYPICNIESRIVIFSVSMFVVWINAPVPSESNTILSALMISSL